ncbi:MAG: hypothetical protein ACRDIC_04275, partial [bacterium]
DTVGLCVTRQHNDHAVASLLQCRAPGHGCGDYNDRQASAGDACDLGTNGTEPRLSRAGLPSARIADRETVVWMAELEPVGSRR